MEQIQLNEYRVSIDNLDRKIFKLFEKRFEIVKKVGKYKKQNNLPVRNEQRENELVAEIINAFPDLNADFINELYNLIFTNSYKIEE